MHVHAAARRIDERLGHERRVHAVNAGDFLHDQLMRHDGIGHRERVGVAQVDLVLRGAAFVMGVFDGNPHLLERKHRVAAKIRRVIEAGQVEVATAVKQFGRLGRPEIVELELGPDIENKALISRFVHHATEHLARVTFKRRAIGQADIAEHARHGVLRRTPRQHLKRFRIGKCKHVGFFGWAEPGHAAAVEAHALGERRLDFGGRHGERLACPQHVGEPQADEMHVAALDGLHHEIEFGVHAAFPSVCSTVSSMIVIPYHDCNGQQRSCQFT